MLVFPEVKDANVIQNYQHFRRTKHIFNPTEAQHVVYRWKALCELFPIRCIQIRFNWVNPPKVAVLYTKRKEGTVLLNNATDFIYGYMASDIS